jgi:hypothetical protein
LNPLHFLGEVKYYVLRNTTQNIIMTGFALKRRKVLKETWVSFTGFPLLGFLYLDPRRRF